MLSSVVPHREEALERRPLREGPLESMRLGRRPLRGKASQREGPREKTLEGRGPLESIHSERRSIRDKAPWREGPIKKALERRALREHVPRGRPLNYKASQREKAQETDFGT